MIPLSARLARLFGGRGRRPAGNAEAGRAEPAPGGGARAGALDRLALAQSLWGEGFLTPGGADHVLDVVRPLGLGPAMRLADLSAGLGGAGRAIAAAFHVHVTGFERDPEAARLGMAMSVAAGLAQRAPVAAYDPEAFALAPGTDCALVRLASFDLADKDGFLRTIMAGLRPGGQLLLAELMHDPGLVRSPALAAWVAGEKRAPALWSLDEYRGALESAGATIRVSENASEPYGALILRGWAGFLARTDLRGLTRPEQALVLETAEYWLRRHAALNTGALRLYRIHAVRSR